jgi:hypothetical protein
MSLYTITIGNSFSDDQRTVLVLSNEPLFKNSSSLNNGLITLHKYNDYDLENIIKVEKSKIIINAWDKNDFSELEEIKNKIN